MSVLMVGTIEVGEGNVGTTAEGALQCSRHSDKDWCGCIKTAIMSNRDAELIWQDDDQPGDMTTMEIVVPMLPSHFQTATVTLGMAGPGGSYHCYLTSDSTDPGDFIGFFAPGEGRMVLRTMIYDWFRNKMGQAAANKTSVTCASTKHSYRQEMIFQSDVQAGLDTSNYTAQMWSIITTGKCRTCEADSLRVGSWEDADDLVPDDGKSSYSPWK